MKRRILLAALALVVGAAAFFAWQIGPRNIVGMLVYDRRREGDLEVGDPAPDVAFAQLDGHGEVRLSQLLGTRRTVLVFGSYT